MLVNSAVIKRIKENKISEKRTINLFGVSEVGEKQLDDDLATEPQVSDVLILKRNSLCPFLCFNQLERDNYFFFNQEGIGF